LEGIWRGLWERCQESKKFFDELVTKGYLATLPRASFSFTASHTTTYIWKKQSYTSDPSHLESTKRRVSSTDYTYIQSVRSCEAARLGIESSILDYTCRFQDYELARQRLTKSRIEKLMAHFTGMAGTITTLVSDTSVLLESLDPSRQISLYIERDRTGTARLAPLIYRNFYSGNAGLYGISVEELARRDGSKVPRFVSECIEYIERTGVRIGAEGADRGVFDIWVEGLMNVVGVHALREELNGVASKDGVRFSAVLKKYPLPIVIAALRMFLQELPVSVVCNDVYDTLKMLYLSKSEDFDVKARTTSVASLLATLPTANYHTLSILAYYFCKLVGKDDARILAISGVMGRVLLRPRVDTRTTLFDKHPERFCRDLMNYCSDLVAKVRTKTVTSATIVSSRGSLVMNSDDEDDDLLDVDNGVYLSKEGLSSSVSIGSGLGELQGEKTIVKNEAVDSEAGHQVYSIE